MLQETRRKIYSTYCVFVDLFRPWLHQVFIVGVVDFETAALQMPLLLQSKYVKVQEGESRCRIKK
jgi:hypothetical protein